MPVSAAEVFGTDPAAPPAQGSPPSDGKGISMEEVYGLPPKPPAEPSRLDKASAAVKSVGGELAKRERAIGADYKERVSEALKNINAYNEELKKDVNANPEGWGPQVLQTSKVALAAVNSVLATGAAAWELTGVPAATQGYAVKPIKEGLEKISAKVQAHLDAKKKGDSNWALHKEDVADLTENLNKAQEFLLQAVVGLIGGGPLGEEGTAARAGRATHRAAEEVKGARPVEAVRPPDVPPPATETPKPVIKVVGKTPEGKPRVRLVTDHAKANVSDALTKVAPMAEVERMDSELHDLFTLRKDWLEPHNNAAPLYLEALSKGEAVGAHSVLDKMLANIPSVEAMPKYARSFLETLRAHVDNVPIKFVRELDLDGTPVTGLYDPVAHEIHIKYDTDVTASNPRVTQTVAHELVHAATVRFMRINSGHPLVKEIEELWKEARYRNDRYNNENPEGVKQLSHYGLTNPEEFVAELFSRDTFQSFLARSHEYRSPKWPEQIRNLYQRFATIVQRMLGIKDPQQASLLHRAMNVGTRIMHEQSTGPTNVEWNQIMEAISNRKAPDLSLVAMKDKELPGEKNLAAWIDWLNRSVNPEGLGGKARQAAAIIAHRMAVKRRAEAVWMRGSKARAEYWKANPEQINDFMEKMESGETFHDNPQLQALKQQYKVWAENIYQKDTLWTGLKYKPQDNYIPHVFKPEDQEAVIDYLNAKYKRKWGDPGFIKERSYATIKEAKAAGFELRYKTPEEMMLARQQASDIAEMQTDILKDLSNQGLATRKMPGVKQQPKTTPRRAPNGDLYYVDNHAFAVLHNAFDSYSLWGDKTPVGSIYRGAMSLKNALVVAKLALSGFHALHVLGIDSAAVLSRVAEGLLTGTANPTKVLKDVLAGATLHRAFWEHPRLGGAIVRAFDNPDVARMMGSHTEQLIQYMLEGGFTPHLDFVYKAVGEKGVLEAAKSLSIKEPLALPYALMAAMRKPLFDIWIPNLKAASYAKDVEQALKMDPSLLENDMKRKMRLRQIANSIDNRYGEMLYNNLFWKKFIKDIGTLGMLSMGWSLGFLREFGGGAMDVGKFGRAVVQGQAAPALRGGALHKPLFAAMYMSQAMMLGGMMTWAMTGGAPSEWKDYVFPRIGGKNSDGTPRRVTTMFYTREIPMIAKHMETKGVISGISDLALSKGSGTFGLLAEMATNMNYFGQQISDPDAPLVKQVGQKLAYAFSDSVEPISIRSLVQAGDVKGGALAIAGFGPAPKYITDTKTEGAIKETFRRFVAPAQVPYDRAMFSTEMKAYREAASKDPAAADALLTKMQDKYQLNFKEVNRLRKTAEKNEDPSIVMFKMIGEKDWHLQKKLLDQMTPEERERYLPYSNKSHLRSHYEEPQE